MSDKNRRDVPSDLLDGERGAFDSVTVRLLEAQNYRCCICGFRIEKRPKGVEFTGGSPRSWAIKTSVVPSQPRLWANSVMVCKDCQGEFGNYDGYQVYERYILGMREKQAAAKRARIIIYPEMPAKIETAVYAKAAELSIPYEYINRKFAHYETTPPSRFNYVVNKLVKGALVRQQSINGKVSKASLSRRRQRAAALERQNHRCCYCGTSMLTNDRHRNMARYATWEHVEKYEHVRHNLIDNLVMACLICNNIRGHIDLDAEDFAEWAKWNLDLIEQLANDFDAGIKIFKGSKPFAFTDKFKELGMYKSEEELTS